MLTPDQVRQLAPDTTLSDTEAEQLRDALRTLSELVWEAQSQQHRRSPSRVTVGDYNNALEGEVKF
jgi:hypothetical protein